MDISFTAADRALASLTDTNAKEDSDKCHFLDNFLPELRLMVYEELLLYDEEDPDKKVHPQILATCSFINKEAQDMLNVKNLNTTTLWRVRLNSKRKPTVRHGMSPAEPIPRAEKMSKEVAMFNPLPPQIRRVVIELELSNDQPYYTVDSKESSQEGLEDAMPHARLQLYRFVSQIQASAAVERVDLKIRLRGAFTHADKVHYLTYISFPIRHLALTNLLSIHGWESAPFVKPLYTGNSHREPILTTTTLVRWVEIDHEIKSLADLFAAAGMAKTGIRYLSAQLTAAMKAPEADSHGNSYEYIDRESYNGAKAIEALWQLREGVWKGPRLQAEARLREAGEDAQPQT